MLVFLHDKPGIQCVQEEIIAFVRRRSSAFSRGRSAFRGVSGHAGRWEARIGCFNHKKNVSTKVQIRALEGIMKHLALRVYSSLYCKDSAMKFTRSISETS